MYKIMFSAGEASGDLHGACLAKALYSAAPDVELIGFGGPRMAAAGVRLCEDFRDYSVMGFWEVLLNLRRMFRLRDKLVAFMRAEKPDLLVLIDYPDFNWRLAGHAKKMGVSVFSYIPPSAWAWRKGRAKTCAALADEIVTIFPFDIKVYEQAGANISFVGNPLVDSVKATMAQEQARQYFSITDGMYPILLLPGSRRQEISLLLPVMLEAARNILAELPQAVFFLPVAPGIDASTIEHMAQVAQVPVRLTSDAAYDLMGLAQFALAASGTVVLEAALMGLPSIVLYRMSAITCFIGRLLVHVEYFSLPNILADRCIQPELLQDEVNVPRILQEARRFYQDEAHAAEVKAELALACEKLGLPDAAGRIAKCILAAAKRSHEKLRRASGEKG